MSAGRLVVGKPLLKLRDFLRPRNEVGRGHGEENASRRHLLQRLHLDRNASRDGRGGGGMRVRRKLKPSGQRYRGVDAALGDLHGLEPDELLRTETGLARLQRHRQDDEDGHEKTDSEHRQAPPRALTSLVRSAVRNSASGCTDGRLDGLAQRLDERTGVGRRGRIARDEGLAARLFAALPLRGLETEEAGG